MTPEQAKEIVMILRKISLQLFGIAMILVIILLTIVMMSI